MPGLVCVCVCVYVCVCVCVGLEFKLGSLKVVGMCWGVTVVCEVEVGVALYWRRGLVGVKCVCVCVDGFREGVAPPGAR